MKRRKGYCTGEEEETSVSSMETGDIENEHKRHKSSEMFKSFSQLNHWIILYILEYLGTFGHSEDSSNIEYQHWYPYSITQLYSNKIEFGYFKNDTYTRRHLLTHHLLLGNSVTSMSDYWKLSVSFKYCKSIAACSMPLNSDIHETVKCVSLLSQNSYLESLAYLQSDVFVLNLMEKLIQSKKRNPTMRNAIDSLRSIYINSPQNMSVKSIVAILNTLKNLRTLCLRFIDLSGLTCAHFPLNIPLCTLDLSATNVTDELMIHVLNIPSLHTLYLCNSKHLLPETISAICSCNKFTSLALDGMDLRMEDYQLLAHSSNLKYLSVAYANLDNDKLKILLQSTCIVELIASVMSFIGYSITDGLSPLENNHTLKKLDITGCLIEDIRPIFKNKSLTDLICGDDTRYTLKRLLHTDTDVSTGYSLNKVILKTEDLSIRDRNALKQWSQIKNIQVEIDLFDELKDFASLNKKFSMKNFM
jgi:hypothetical protein